jgi:hypothetical protein
MSKHEAEGREPEPAAQTNLGPAPHSGGDMDTGDRPLPPYDDRQTEAKENFQNHSDLAMAGQIGEPGPGRELSDEERTGVPPTDTSAASPLGVGESITPRGEEQVLHHGGGEARLSDENVEERRKDREEAGIKPDPPISEDMPNLRPGDQGG